MWIRLRANDTRIVLHYVGVFIIGMGIAMLVPLVTAIIFREWAAALDYTLGIGVALALGAGLRLFLTEEARLTHAHALALTALGWLAASVVGAIPLALSGNYATFLMPRSTPSPGLRPRG